jgi:hypothetical protein
MSVEHPMPPEQSDRMQLTATPWKESSATCECCGKTSRTIWGDISTPEKALAIYYVQWTADSAKDLPHIDLIIGPWGEDADTRERILVSLTYQPTRNGGGFMVIDSTGRPADDRRVCGAALDRSAVLNTPLAPGVFQMVDAIWQQDPRIADLRHLDDLT